MFLRVKVLMCGLSQMPTLIFLEAEGPSSGRIRTICMFTRPLRHFNLSDKLALCSYRSVRNFVIDVRRYCFYFCSDLDVGCSQFSFSQSCSEQLSRNRDSLASGTRNISHEHRRPDVYCCKYGSSRFLFYLMVNVPKIT